MDIKNKYSFIQKLTIAIWLFRTKLICSKARIIRFPFDLRGKKYINFGENLTTGIGCRIEAFSQDGNKTIFFGKNVQINDYVHISAMKSVRIGDNVLMASHIYISDNSHGSYKGDENDSNPDIVPAKRKYSMRPVLIQDNVWIGEHVVILPGVTIGKGAIIGANSVVSKSVEPYTICIGQPAMAIKRYNFATQIWEKL